MSSAAHRLLEDLRALGVTVVVDGGRLRFKPAAAVTTHLLEQIKAEKPALMELVSRGRAQRGSESGGTPPDPCALIDAIDLLHDLQQAGAQPHSAGGALGFAREEVLTPELRQRLEGAEDDILTWLHLAGPDCQIELDPAPLAQTAVLTLDALSIEQPRPTPAQAVAPKPHTTGTTRPSQWDLFTEMHAEDAQ